MNSINNKEADQNYLHAPENKQKILNVENIIAIMVSQDVHLDVKESSKIIACFFETIDGVLKKGYRVNTPLFNVFEGNANQLQTPVLETHTDVNTSSENNDITPGGIINITGRHLVFDLNDTKQGVFYIAENKQEYRVNATGRMMGNELLFFAPDNLPKGNYNIEIRTMAEAGNMLMCGALNVALTITDKYKRAGLK